MTINETDLRQHGVRLTPQRRMILDALAQGRGHTTAEEIHQRVVASYPDVSLSTVYRNLERLLELRLIAVTDLGGGHVSYETLTPARHHHLICRSCGSITQMSDDAVRELCRCIAHTANFLAEIDHLALWGLCAACGSEEATTQGG